MAERWSCWDDDDDGLLLPVKLFSKSDMMIDLFVNYRLTTPLASHKTLDFTAPPSIMM